MTSSQKAELPSRIENNILIGDEELIDNDCSNVGQLILNAFKEKPDLIGQVDELKKKQSTFQQMRERSVKCALWLKTQEMKPGDVIVTCTSNQLDAYVPFLASLYTGVIINPWNDQCDLNNIEYFLKLTTPKAIFVNGNKAVTVHEVAMKLCISPKIVVYDEVEGFESLESILDDKHFDKNEVNEFSCTTSNMRNTAVMLFSSGTTGLPKAVEISQTMFIVPAIWQVPSQSSGSVGLWFGSLSWITSVILTVRTILSFSTAVKYAGFDSEKVCRVIEKYKVSWMLMETGMCNYLLQSGALAKYDISSLRQVMICGSAIKPDTYENIIKVLPGVRITTVYGLTETGGSVTCQTDTGKIGSSGYVCKNTRLMITDLDTGKPLGFNMRGEVCVKCPSIMNGYYKNPESTKNAFNQDGWFLTGDVGYYDKDGDIFIVDRIKELIKYKGHQISPMEIEALLQTHPSVCECAVIPVPHRLDGQHPIAFVKKISGAEVTGEELEQLVSMNMSDYKKLRGGVVFMEDIPRLANGKIDRKKLRDITMAYATE